MGFESLVFKVAVAILVFIFLYISGIWRLLRSLPILIWPELDKVLFGKMWKERYAGIKLWLSVEDEYGRHRKDVWDELHSILTDDLGAYARIREDPSGADEPPLLGKETHHLVVRLFEDQKEDNQRDEDLHRMRLGQCVVYGPRKYIIAITKLVFLEMWTPGPLREVAFLQSFEAWGKRLQRNSYRRLLSIALEKVLIYQKLGSRPTVKHRPW